MARPAFLITIDTEGDNLWENHDKIDTHNAAFLPRFQSLCEKYGFKPTWLTNYEMAIDPTYVEFAKDVIARNQGEVGMHLHAWNSPPLHDLTGDDWRHKPYLIEYPQDVIREKVVYMTRLLEQTFQTKMLSHRAGRWAFNEYYASLLIELGYVVDCSVTPRVDWRQSPGNPQGDGGTDYRDFPRHAYFIDRQDIAKAGNSPLLEVPMSIQNKYSPLMNSFKQGINRLRGKRRGPSVNWLRPVGGNLDKMKRVVEQSLADGADYVEFMLHSSEFMPGGSPTFKNEADIDQLYADLEQLFSWLQSRTLGMTLAEYYRQFKDAR
ncbi:polysaccharide deacetylase family protein [Erwiniaceae bacterium BAC15a-03b]|uniref:Polysaccharide deacetylase family protein n=1 Tax=Winslowiella arboricola TaxID=2978220 RepID=A0A9J6PE45_9GAMM|nr:polysaccharide deacetylase family protein [Winslowiella arboricola]MCU5773535.1 polysaccharide deacetylase family protein [Winslowiella arboricola]MCU5776553.1 polysaccharide deacetylase family protein [Winslowiella arboricola]